ncbi:unnamed protein product [Brachionus calyciflorus]|uniref:Uncharacterized protein n=1 Tax=Brachionus calyciflorus TaxID=104777 RepID=A0A814NEM9_9BILA|nr:unnamed protein product [Brachionus calyciflorus]
MSESTLISPNTNNFTSLSLIDRATGFQNPNYIDSYNLEKSNLDNKQNEIILNTYESNEFNSSNSSPKVTSSKRTNEIDLVCCKQVYSIKATTYSNFKRCMQMLKPLGVLFCLILILIVLFRVDIFVKTND